MPGKLSVVWFPKSDQAISLMAGFSVFVLGNSIAMLLPRLIVSTKISH